MAAHAIDVNADSFQREVIEASGQAPVLVDFWAPWCGPCRALTPVLEKLAEQYQGKFRLVKINSDENPELSRQFGVRSIPSVKAFVDGNLVDEFLGARPESAVREFIDGLLPTPADLLRKEATELAVQGERDRALAVLAQATELEPMNDALHADAAEILLGMGRIAEAKAAAARMGPLANQDRRIGALLAQLQFADGDGADSATLEARIAADPNDLEARLALAKALVTQQRHEPAMEQLLEIIRRDRKWNGEAGRKTLLAVFDVLGGQGELVSKYRRQLAAALN
jgi:putative thioredoxin